MHHYPALDHRKIRRMTLRQIMRALRDIPQVNPWLAGADDEKKPDPSPRSKPVHPHGEIKIA